MTIPDNSGNYFILVINFWCLILNILNIICYVWESDYMNQVMVHYIYHRNVHRNHINCSIR